MYRIIVDGQEIYSSALSDDMGQQILSPSLQLEVDTAGSLTFILPPVHKAYDSINKLKSVVTMEWDGVEIFRGRVLEETVDFYNQKEVYCEGFLSYLLDSVQRPETYTGTTRDFIERAIKRHNGQVEGKKRFTLGNTPALTDDTEQEFESDGYSDTLSAIRAVLEDYEGFLVARYEDGVNYLDFLTSQGDDNGEAIEFGVNLLDYENQVSAEDICTVLLPIGGMLDDGTTVTIKSVNDDKDTIEDTEAIKKYGRIVKTYSFDDVTDPAELLTLAQEKLESMAFTETLTLTAVDIHLLDESKGIILPGKQVLIHTTPHGLDNQKKVCTALDLDPENPENATYTFGEITTTQSGTAALIASKVEKHTTTIEKLYQHYTETDYTVRIHAGLLDSQSKYISEAFIELDGINAEILSVTGEVERVDGKIDSEISAITGSALWQDRDKIVSSVGDIDFLAGEIDTITGSTLWQTRDDITGVVGKMSVGDDGKIYIAEGSGLMINEGGSSFGVYTDNSLTAGVIVSKINGGTAILKGNMVDITANEDFTAQANAIALKADQASLDLANGRIDAQANEIALKANKIDLQGYVTMEEFEATNASISNLTSGLTTATVLSANLVKGTQGDFTYLSGDAINLGDNSLVCYTLDFAGRSGKYFGTGGQLDLAHSHEVIVNDDGTITLGEVAAEGGNFKIADTKAYKDGVSAAIASVGFSSFSASGGVITPKLTNDKTTTYYCSAGSVDEDYKIPIYIAADQYGSGSNQLMTVDASDVYQDGYDAGAATGGNVTLSKKWANGVFTVTASNGQTATTTISKGTQSLSGNTYSIPIMYDTNGNTGYTVTVDASARYTAGANSVTLSKKWANGVLTVTASNGKTKTAQLAKGTESWDGDTVSVPVLDGSGSTGYTVMVDASDRYTAGYNAGWAAAVAKLAISGNIIKGPGATVDEQADLYTITAGGSISSIKNTAANYMFAEGYGRAYINGAQVDYKYISKGQSFSLGQ